MLLVSLLTPTAPQHLVCRAVQSLHINHLQMSIIELSICRRLHMDTSMMLICRWLICRLCTALHTKCCGAVTSSPKGLVCLINTGTMASGCLVYLTDTDTGVTYRRVVWRSLDSPVNISFCPSSNGPLSTGVYSVEVYDIERDGSVSSVPAIAG